MTQASNAGLAGAELGDDERRQRRVALASVLLHSAFAFAFDGRLVGWGQAGGRDGADAVDLARHSTVLHEVSELELSLGWPLARPCLTRSRRVPSSQTYSL